MRTNEITEKTCENCRYFVKHYVKHKQGFYYMHAGHCINRVLTDREKRKRSNYEACGCWETDGPVREERRQSIKDAIINIADRLTQMSEILSDDSQNEHS